MVFDGPWRRRRRPYRDPEQSPYGPNDPYGYPPPYEARYRRAPFGSYRGGYGYGANSSCLRDLFFLDAGCCLAEGLGCGANLLLVGPSAARRATLATSARTRPGRRLTQWLLTLIAIYQEEISPRRPACCRFSPTCSHYAAEALRAHGLRRGLWLTARRLVRCRPGAPGGLDPVP